MRDFIKRHSGTVLDIVSVGISALWRHFKNKRIEKRKAAVCPDCVYPNAGCYLANKKTARWWVREERQKCPYYGREGE